VIIKCREQRIVEIMGYLDATRLSGRVDLKSSQPARGSRTTGEDT